MTPNEDSATNADNSAAQEAAWRQTYVDRMAVLCGSRKFAQASFASYFVSGGASNVCLGEDPGALADHHYAYWTDGEEVAQAGGGAEVLAEDQSSAGTQGRGFDPGPMPALSAGVLRSPARADSPMASKGLVYLAIPYSHPDPAVREARFLAANREAALMMGEGVFVFSPISHTHPILEAGELAGGWEHWKAYDCMMLSRCAKLVVLMLEGWAESVGVKAELDFAAEMNIPIEYRSVGWRKLRRVRPSAVTGQAPTGSEPAL